MKGKNKIPTALTEEALQEYEKLWREDHPNQEPEPQQLVDQAIRLLNAMKFAYRPIPRSEVSLLQKMIK